MNILSLIMYSFAINRYDIFYYFNLLLQFAKIF